MEELARARCKQGTLVLTTGYISISQPGGLQQRSISRAALTGLDTRLIYPSLFGLGGGTNLTFYAGAERLHADLVKPKVAANIKRMLGY